MARKKILIITYYWPPSGGAGVQRWLKFSKYLAQLNWEIHVLTVDPNLASYSYLDKSLEIDVSQGITVHRTKTREPYQAYTKLSGKKPPGAGFASGAPKKSIIQETALFIRSNFFIPDPRKSWVKFAVKKASELIKTENIKTVITTSPPHSSQLIGRQLKRKCSINWICDLRDPWTDIYYNVKMRHTSWARKRNRALESSVLSEADAVITVSESLRDLFAKKIGNRDKFHVLTNGFDPDDFVGLSSSLDDDFTVGYMGTLSEQYNVDAFLTGISQLKKSIKIRFVGILPQVIRYKLESLNIHFTELGYLSHLSALNAMKSCHALWLAIPSVVNNEGILTGKLFEYLALKRPIIALGPPDGDAAGIIDNCQAGRLFNYYDVSGQMAYVNSLIDDYPTHVKIEDEDIGRYSRKEISKDLNTIICRIENEDIN